MWKLHRYYLREILVNLALAFGVLFGIVMLAMVPRGLEKAEGFGLWNAVKITTFWALDAFPHLLPVTLVFAIVMTYARAGQDREITAIRAAGISPRVAAVPAILVGIVCSFVGAMLMHYVVPRTHYARDRVVAESIRSLMTGTGMLKDFVQLQGLSMTWEHRDRQGRWEDVQILLEQDRGEGDDVARPPEIILAERAWIELSENGQDLSLVLQSARSHGGTGVFLGDPRIAVNVRDITGGAELDETDSSIATDQLIAEVQRGLHARPREALFEANRRSAFALLPTLLAPIAFCVGVLTRARGRVFALVLGTIPVLIAYATDVIAKSLVRDIDLPMLAWLPVSILLVLGIPFCWRLLRV